MPAYVRTTRVIPTANGRSANSRSRTSGAPPLASTRRSTRPNAANAGTDAARPSQAHSGQPYARPSTSGTTSRQRATVSATAPGRSGRRARGARDSGTNRPPSSSVTTPTGTLTQKTGRHEEPKRSAAISRPPTSCPDIVAMPMTAPSAPKALGRSASGISTWITAKTCGNIAAAPRPWTSRAAIRAPEPGASAQPTEARVNSAIPVRNSRLRP